MWQLQDMVLKPNLFCFQHNFNKTIAQQVWWKFHEGFYPRNAFRAVFKKKTLGKRVFIDSLRLKHKPKAFLKNFI